MGLLKGINPALTADLLYILRSMGHGDKLCLSDCNFPAATVATHTTTQKHVILTCDLPQALDAVCSVLPLDFFEPKQASFMAPQSAMGKPADDVKDMPEAAIEVVEALQATIHKHCPDAKIEPSGRFDFYDEAKTCFAVVQTLERRPYGNVILTKGCVGPDGNDLKP